MLERGTREEPLRERIDDGGGGAFGRKSRKRRRRPDIGAGSGGARQNAAKTVMASRISARSSRTRSIQATGNTANSAGESGGGSRRGGGEESLQQKCVKRERAQRGAPCNRTLRTLAETHHPQSLQHVPLSRSLLAKHRNNGRSERIRTSGPLVPNEVRYQAALHSGAPPNLVSGRTLLGRL
jgi:hypothetical protein